MNLRTQEYYDNLDSGLCFAANLCVAERAHKSRNLRAVSAQDADCLLQNASPDTPWQRADFSNMLGHLANIVCYDIRKTLEAEYVFRPERDFVVIIHGPRPFAYTDNTYVAYGSPEEVYSNDIDLTLATPFPREVMEPIFQREFNNIYSKLNGHGRGHKQASRWVDPYYLLGDGTHTSMDLHYMQITPDEVFDDQFLQTYVPAYSSLIGSSLIRGQLNGYPCGFEDIQFNIWQPFPKEVGAHLIHIPYPDDFGNTVRSLVRIPRVVALRVSASYETQEVAQFSSESIAAMQLAVERFAETLTDEQRENVRVRIATEMFKASVLLDGIKSGKSDRKLMYADGVLLGPESITRDLDVIGFNKAIFGK